MAISLPDAPGLRHRLSRLWARLARIGRWLFEVGADHCPGVIALKGLVPGQQLVGHHGKAVEVGTAIQLCCAVGLFGGNVVGGTEYIPGRGQHGVLGHEAGDAKVHQDGALCLSSYRGCPWLAG